MPVTVWLRIQGGDIVETAKDVVVDVNADMGDEYRPGSIRDRVGQIDWAAAGRQAGAVAAKGIRSMGGAMRMAGPQMIIMLVAEWFLDGALAMLRTEAGKPAAEALTRLGDVMLDVIAKVIRPMIPLLLRAIKAIYPVLFTILDILGSMGVGAADALQPALDLMLAVWKLITKLAGKIDTGLTALAIKIGGAWALIHNALRRIQRTIDGAVDALVGGFRRLLDYILEWVLGPIHTHLENLSALWDEWIGRYLTGEESLRHPLGYMWNDVWYEWGTGPLGEEPHEPAGRIVEHLATEAQLVRALGEYSRANGGLARALWGPV